MLHLSVLTALWWHIYICAYPPKSDRLFPSCQSCVANAHHLPEDLMSTMHLHPKLILSWPWNYSIVLPPISNSHPPLLEYISLSLTTQKTCPHLTLSSTSQNFNSLFSRTLCIILIAQQHQNLVCMNQFSRHEGEFSHGNLVDGYGLGTHVERWTEMQGRRCLPWHFELCYQAMSWAGSPMHRNLSCNQTIADTLAPMNSTAQRALW